LGRGFEVWWGLLPLPTGEGLGRGFFLLLVLALASGEAERGEEGGDCLV